MNLYVKELYVKELYVKELYVKELYGKELYVKELFRTFRTSVPNILEENEFQMFELFLKSNASLSFGIGFSMSESPRSTHFQPDWSEMRSNLERNLFRTFPKGGSLYIKTL